MNRRTKEDATVYTDEHASYKGIPRYHQAVAHGAGEYVKETAHTNGLETRTETLGWVEEFGK